MAPEQLKDLKRECERCGAVRMGALCGGDCPKRDELLAEIERLRAECDLMHARTSEAIAEKNAANNEVAQLRAMVGKISPEQLGRIMQAIKAEIIPDPPFHCACHACRAKRAT